MKKSIICPGIINLMPLKNLVVGQKQGSKNNIRPCMAFTETQKNISSYTDN